MPTPTPSVFVYLAASRDRHPVIGFRGLGNRACYAWFDAGWMLDGCWLDAGLMLAGCWLDAGWLQIWAEYACYLKLDENLQMFIEIRPECESGAHVIQ